MIKQADTLLQAAKDFSANRVRPLAAFFDQGNGIPRELITDMGRSGLLGAPLPTRYGGGGADARLWGEITREIGKACCSVRSVLTVHSALIGETIVRLGNDEQKNRLLPDICSGKQIGAFALSEPDTGSDARGIKTAYAKTGEGYTINGVKKWITLGDLADFFIVIAQDQGRISAFFVERERTGITSVPLNGIIGNRGSHIAEVTLRDVYVPQSNLFCGEGMGFSHVVNTAMDFGRSSIAWAGLAIAEEALECMTSYALQRKQFGALIGTLGGVRTMIADAAVAVHAGRRLCEHAAHSRTERSVDLIHDTITAKYFTSRAAVQITNNAVQLYGANGCSSQFLPERLLREAKILEVIEGTSQVLQEVIADYALTKYSPLKKNTV
ncbi:MAG: acyl-CoA dehydrogenase family protein [Chitinophagaceae bacterium]